MNIDYALSQFRKSEYGKTKIGSRVISEMIDTYLEYKGGILLIPNYAHLVPDSYLYLVEANGSIKEIPPVQVATDTNIGQVHKINK